MNEDHVAFHEVVTLLGWKDSSSRGPKITIGLSGRPALEHFDKATRRKGKRAGQRYHAAVQTLDSERVDAVDLWFAGANWAHQDGARVVFTVDEEGLDFFLGMTAKDENSGTPAVFYLTLVQVDEDETPIDQRKAAIVEAVIGQLEPNGLGPDADVSQDAESMGRAIGQRPKGGPYSKRVAMLCQDDEFQWYVAEKIDSNDKATFEQADAYVKVVCGVTSKVEFDHDDTAWVAFSERITQPFLEWAGAAPT